MIKSKEEIIDRGIEIDLTGPQGNAFFLIGQASSLCKQLAKDKQYRHDSKFIHEGQLKD